VGTLVEEGCTALTPAVEEENYFVATATAGEDPASTLPVVSYFGYRPNSV